MSYFGGKVIGRRRSMAMLAAFVSACALPLVLFKVASLIGLEPALLPQGNVLTSGSFLPIAVSFYTLQAIGYLVDAYRRSGPLSPDISTHALFLALFPQLLAGPIERASNLIPQLRYLLTPSTADLYVGAKTILWGYFCKLVIADNIGGIVDRLLATHATIPAPSIIVALYLYSFQIYFDFFGYSLIAIGLARTFGIRLTPNFNKPYLAASLRDFWRRWHISLSSWLRDYVYHPLGGHKKGTAIFVLAVAVTFFVSALWHGASTNFLLWGTFHAALFVLADFTITIRSRIKRLLPRIEALRPAQHALSVWLCFSIVSFAWLFFRVDNVNEISNILSRLLGWASEGFPMQLAPLLSQPETLMYLALLVSVFCLDASGLVDQTVNSVPRQAAEIARELAVVNFAAISLLFLGDLGTREFIYFRF